MKTILILALIVMVCMCSGGDVFGTVKPGKGEEDKPSSSVGDEKSGQDDGQIGCDVMEKRIMEGAKQQESALEEINEILRKEPLEEDDMARIKQLICSALDLEEDIIDDNKFRSMLQKWMSDTSTLQSLLESTARKGPSANPNSSSRQSGDNQTGADGVRDERKEKQEKNGESVAKNPPERPSGVATAFSRNGRISMQDENMHQENTERDLEVAAIQNGGKRRSNRRTLGCAGWTILAFCAAAGLIFVIIKFAIPS
jgi:hypothetical protein